MSMSFVPALLTDQNVPVDLHGELPPEMVELNEPSARATEKVQAELSVNKDEEGKIFVTGWVKTSLKLQCGRCAEWLPWPIRCEFNHVFEPPYPNSLDMEPLIREDLLLELPLVAACQLEANGRCPVTGEIHHPVSQTSPPLTNEKIWEALDKLDPYKIKLKENHGCSET